VNILRDLKIPILTLATQIGIKCGDVYLELFTKRAFAASILSNPINHQLEEDLL